MKQWHGPYFGSNAHASWTNKEEELEMTTMKITDRKTEAEATNNNLNARRAQVEKV